MRKALFAGTFNPPTLGHADLIRRAAKLFDHLYVGVAINFQKEKGPFSLESRMQMLTSLSMDLPSVSIVAIPGLVADFVAKHQVDVFIRGLRNQADFIKEAEMGSANRRLANVETLFLLSDPKYAYLSSSLVREVGAISGSLIGFVPLDIVEFVETRLQKPHKNLQI